MPVATSESFLKEPRPQFTDFIQTAIPLGISFLEKSCNPIYGFQQDSTGPDRKHLTPNYWPDEILLSLFALEFLDTELSPNTVSILTKYVYPENAPRTVNFFKSAKIVPDDVEDTSLLHWYFLKTKKLNSCQQMMDLAKQICLNVDDELGVIQTYFPPRPESRNNRIDYASLSIVMRFLYCLDLEGEAKSTEEHIHQFLVSKAYLSGSRYYNSPDCFLFYCAKAVACSRNSMKRFKEPLLKEIKARLAKWNDFEGPVDLALRLLAIFEVGLHNVDYDKYTILLDMRKTVNTLISLQNEDGSWPKDALYGMPTKNLLAGGYNLSTIFCVAALIAYRDRVEL